MSANVNAWLLVDAHLLSLLGALVAVLVVLVAAGPVGARLELARADRAYARRVRPVVGRHARPRRRRVRQLGVPRLVWVPAGLMVTGGAA
jgi:hypothetical protein